MYILPPQEAVALERRGPAVQCPSGVWRCHPGILFAVIASVVIGGVALYYLWRNCLRERMGKRKSSSSSNNNNSG